MYVERLNSGTLYVKYQCNIWDYVCENCKLWYFVNKLLQCNSKTKYVYRENSGTMYVKHYNVISKTM